MLCCVLFVLAYFITNVKPANASRIDWSICKQNVKRINCIVDGDTYWKHGVKYRIFGLDTPEKGNRAKCSYERRLSNQATNSLLSLFQNSIVSEQRVGIDRYNRVLAKTFVNGRNVADILISQGLGVVYNAQARRQGIWCK